MAKGWYKESYRHSLAAKGIKTNKQIDRRLKSYNSRVINKVFSQIGGISILDNLTNIRKNPYGLPPKQFLQSRGDIIVTQKGVKQKFHEFIERQKEGYRRAKEKHPWMVNLTMAEITALFALSGGATARGAMPIAFAVPGFLQGVGRPENGDVVDDVPVRTFQPLRAIGSDITFATRTDQRDISGHHTVVFKHEDKANEWLDKHGYIITAKGLTKKEKGQVKAYQEAYAKTFNKEGELVIPFYQNLGQEYKKYWLTSSGIKKSDIDDLIANNKVSLRVIDSKSYDKMPEEKLRFTKGEMSYAQTKISPKGIFITIRKGKDPNVTRKLLNHEKEEINIFRTLKNLNVHNAVDVAHELTRTKVNDREVDKAFGDIGDPV